MWLGLNASTEFISNVFGVPVAAQVDTDKTSLPAIDNPLSLKIRNLIESIREERHRSMRVSPANINSQFVGINHEECFISLTIQFITPISSLYLPNVCRLKQ